MGLLSDEIAHALQNDSHIHSVHRHDDALIVTIAQRVFSVMHDVDFDRTVIWTALRQLSASEMPAGLAVTTQLNQDLFAADGIAMGLLADRDTLIIGRSLAGQDIPPRRLIEALLELHGASDEALGHVFEACVARPPSIPLPDRGEMIRV